jgi:hypothetical protein
VLSPVLPQDSAGQRKHDSYRTVQAYVGSIKRYILSRYASPLRNGVLSLSKDGPPEIEAIPRRPGPGLERGARPRVALRPHNRPV